MYPSRSELIRVAVRSFLIRELDVVDSFEEYSKKKPGPKPGKKLKIVHQEDSEIIKPEKRVCIETLPGFIQDHLRKQ